MSARMIGSVIISLTLVIGMPAPSIRAQEYPVFEQAGSAAGAPEISAADQDAKGEDGKEDREEKKGPKFIPVPIFITEPAIGYGLGGAVGYFHPKKEETEEDSGTIAPAVTADTAGKVGKRQKVPPTITGVGGAYTENGTWGVGFAHSASWKKDRIRYLGAVGYVNVISTFYFLDAPFEFKLRSALLLQDIKFRIGSSPFLLGGKLVYLNPQVTFKRDLGDLPVEPEQDRLRDVGIAVAGSFEGRDNKMTPNRGQFVELVLWKHFEQLGGETDYWKLGIQAQSFHELVKEKLILGLRIDFDGAAGDPPLWGYPWISMRGIPALRYQNEQTGVAESELRWNFTDRWAVVGFVGVGASRGDAALYEDASGIVAGGIGGRFLFRPQDALWVGLDVAQGPEDTALYIQVGHAW